MDTETLVTDLEKDIDELTQKAFGEEPAPEATIPDEPVAEVAVEQAVTPEPEETPVPDVAPDELSTVTKRWKDGVRWNTKLNKENLQLHGDVEQLTVQLESLKAKLDAPAPVASEKLKKVQEEYPELTTGLIPAIEEIISAKNKTVTDELAELRSLQKSNQQVAAKQELYEAHSDVDMVTADDSYYWKWLAQDTSVPASIKQLASDSKSVKDNIAIVSLFKKEFSGLAKSSEPKPKEVAETTVEPKRRSVNPVVTGVSQPLKRSLRDIEKMSLEEFSKLSNDELSAIGQEELARVAML